MNTETVEFLHLDWVEASIAGNAWAQQKLYNQYARQMFSLCLTMLKNKEEAEDVLQDAFVMAFKNLKYYRKESTFGAWLKRIVINTCINALKKRKIDSLSWNDDLEFKAPIEVEEVDFEDELLQVAQIKQGIRQLSAGYRTIISLYLLEGYDHREIAEILNISESTSKSQYMRARIKLKEILKTTSYAR